MTKPTKPLSEVKLRVPLRNKVHKKFPGGRPQLGFSFDLRTVLKVAFSLFLLLPNIAGFFAILAAMLFFGHVLSLLVTSALN